MKNLDITKKVVLAIGSISIFTGMFELVLKGTALDNFFPIYIGLTLIGTVIFNKKEAVESVA